MSTTTEAIELVKLLKPKIGEQAATKLVDYADKQRSDEVSRGEFNLLRLLVVGGFTLSFIIMGVLYNEIKSTRLELKEDMRSMESRLIRAIEKKKITSLYKI